MSRMFKLLAGCCWIALFGCTSSQQAVDPVAESPGESVSTLLPEDPQVVSGTLENGLRFFIRKNQKPENRAELRLVVNAGSILENEDQQGLAHFAEHMAFNGTKNFPKQELVDYLEGIGMRFGPDLNAYTSFDETVYMLQVPTDSTQIVEKAFHILQDWASAIAFEDEEIDKERGVVIEEWRLGRGAGARLRDKQFPILLKDSQYAQRLPIGQKAVLDTFKYDTVRQFYRDWYRPDLMAVVAVGDFEPEWMERLIREYFSGIPAVENPRARTYFPVPGNEETLFAIATDPEASRTSVSIYYKQPVREEGTEAAYRQSLVESLYNGMLNARLSELTKKPDAPFLYGNSGQGRFIRTKEFYYLGAGVKEDGIIRGLEALLTEGARVQQHGFTQTELERQKVEMLRGMERTYEERDKLQSRGFASEYIRHYLVGEPIPGIAYEYGLYQKLIPGIRLEEVNRMASEWITDHDRVILVDGPEKADVEMPTEEELAKAIARVAQEKVVAYEDRVSDQPLVETLPKPSEIVGETQIAELGVTEWTLGNGVKVVLKSTDFKNDQVLFSAFSPGGHSLVSDEDYVAATSAVSVLRESGAGTFDLVALQKKLAGKAVGVSPWIGDVQEGINGSASPKDLETLFQLIYLSFTAPRKDTTAFLAYKERMLGMLKNRNADPRAAFGDTLQVTLAQHHFRARPWSEALLEEMDLDRSLAVYKDRFADASDFTFVFVGNLDTAQVKPLVKTYLGGLPALHRNEIWKDIGMRPPEGVLEKIVRKGLEPKSNTRIVFTGPFEWTRQNRYELDAMTQVLGIKLREVMREDMGGTYGVGVWESTSRYPREGYSINVSFGCSPERVNELTEAVFAQIDSLKQVGTTDVYLNKVKESQRRGREVAMKENGFWRGALASVYEHGQDPLTILTYNELVEGLTLEAVQQAAQKYFNMGNYVRVVLYPETMEGKGE